MNLPTLAIWLMNRFGVDEGLVGDLAEQISRSGFWLWRQTLGSILIAMTRDLRAHPVLALRAVFLGTLLQFPLHTFQLWLWSLVSIPFASVAFAIGLRHLALSGSVANTLLAMPGSFCMGWLIACLHRSRTPAPVLSFLIVTWCFAIPTVSRQFSNALSDPRFHPYLAIQLMGICAFSFSVMAGGLWRKGTRHELA